MPVPADTSIPPMAYKRVSPTSPSPHRYAVEHGLSYARGTQRWVVLVCPNSTVLASCQRVLAGLLSSSESFGGRTMILEGGGRLSLVAADNPWRPNVPFRVQFVGWKATHPVRKMQVWQETAEMTIQSE